MNELRYFEMCFLEMDEHRFDYIVDEIKSKRKICTGNIIDTQNIFVWNNNNDFIQYLKNIDRDSVDFYIKDEYFYEKWNYNKYKNNLHSFGYRKYAIVDWNAEFIHPEIEDKWQYFYDKCDCVAESYFTATSFSGNIIHAICFYIAMNDELLSNKSIFDIRDTLIQNKYKLTEEFPINANDEIFRIHILRIKKIVDEIFKNN